VYFDTHNYVKGRNFCRRNKNAIPDTIYTYSGLHNNTINRLYRKKYNNTKIQVVEIKK